MYKRLIASLLASSLALCAAPKIVRVWGDYVQAASFERIAEYFGAPESHPGRSVLRTQANSRDGYYFLVRINAADTIPEGAHWLIEVLRPNERTPVSFEIANQSKSKVYQLGLTGSDWPNAKEVPVAWKVSLLSADGQTVLAHESFLWN